MTLNIPPFLSEKGKFDEEEVETAQSIASVRIHVERAISRIKMYKIINNVVPLSLSDLDIMLHATIISVFNHQPGERGTLVVIYQDFFVKT